MTRESTTLVAEFVGTFLLTGAVLFGLNPAVALGVLVLLMSGFSAAHFNPAVSAGMAAARRITGATMVKFWIVQVLGALLARVAYGYFMADKVSLAMSFKTVDAKMFLAEVVGGAIFVGGIMLAIKQGLGSLKLGAAVGGALFLGAMMGGGLNPAVAFGFENLSVWTMVGALLGGVIGAVAADAMVVKVKK